MLLVKYSCNQVPVLKGKQTILKKLTAVYRAGGSFYTVIKYWCCHFKCNWLSMETVPYFWPISNKREFAILGDRCITIRRLADIGWVWDLWRKIPSVNVWSLACSHFFRMKSESVATFGHISRKSRELFDCRFTQNEAWVHQRLTHSSANGSTGIPTNRTKHMARLARLCSIF